MHIDFISLTIIVMYLLIIMVIGYILSQVHFRQLSATQSEHWFWRNIAFAHYGVSRSNTFATILATLISGGMVFGLVSLLWQDGIIFYFATVSYASGLLCFYLFNDKIRQMSNKYWSFEGFLSNNHRLNSLLIASVNLYLYFSVVVVQMVALKILLNAYFEANIATILFLAIATFVFVYVTKFGFVGIVSTDKFQILGILLMFMFLLYFIVENRVLIDETNLQSMVRDYPQDPRFGWPVIISLIFLFPWTLLCRQEYWQRIVSAESNQASKSAILWAIVIYVILATIIFIVVLQLKAKNTITDDSEIIIFNVIADSESILLFAVLIVGLMLCTITSFDTYLNCLLLSTLAGLHAFTTKHSYSNTTLNYLHNGLSLLLYALLMYCLLFVDIDLNFWFLCGYGCAIPLLPTFFSALLNKHDSLATTLSVVVSFSFVLYITLTGTLVESDILIIFLLCFISYAVGLCLSWLKRRTARLGH